MWTQCPPEYAFALARTRGYRWASHAEKAAAFTTSLSQAMASVAAHHGRGDGDRAGDTPLVLDDTWTGGDWELISADGVCLRVPSYYLLAIR